MNVGYFGKLPQRADFVASGLPERFLSPFDLWLRQGLQRGKLAWNFALAAGVAGPDAVAGVMVPSRDRTGRDFPLVVACLAPAGPGAAAVAAMAAPWLDWAGRAAQQAAAGTLSPSDLDALLRRQAPPVFRRVMVSAGQEWRVVDGGGLAAALPALLDATLGLRRASLWWGGSGALLCDGLPPQSRMMG